MEVVPYINNGLCEYCKTICMINSMITGDKLNDTATQTAPNSLKKTMHYFHLLKQW
jgi:hypothetical protein